HFAQGYRLHDSCSFALDPCLGGPLCAELPTLLLVPARLGRARALLPCRHTCAPWLCRRLRDPLGSSGSLWSGVVVSRDGCVLLWTVDCRRLGRFFRGQYWARRLLLWGLCSVAIVAGAPAGSEPTACCRRLGRMRVCTGKFAHRQPLGVVRLFTDDAHKVHADCRCDWP